MTAPAQQDAAKCAAREREPTERLAGARWQPIGETSVLAYDPPPFTIPLFLRNKSRGECQTALKRWRFRRGSDGPHDWPMRQRQPSSLIAQPAFQIFVIWRILSPAKSMT